MTLLRLNAGSDQALYGVAFNADGNSNTTIGQYGNPGQRLSFRERIDHTGTINEVAAYVKVGVGYSLGTGGTLRLTIEADDGTANHRPSGTPLTTQDVTPGNTGTGQVQVFTLSSPLAVQYGDLRHFVFTNVSADPTADYVSINGLDMQDFPNPQQPYISNVDQITLTTTTATFAEAKDRYPIIDIRYADGYHGGQAYYAALRTTQATIQGANEMVRLNFTPTKTRTIRNVFAKLFREAGTTQDLVATLEVIGGATVATANIPASIVNVGVNATGYGSRWVTKPLAATITAGVNYALRLSSPGETVPYHIFPTQGHGGAAFGVAFAAPNVFDEGYWEKTVNGSTWTLQSSTQAYKPMIYFS